MSRILYDYHGKDDSTLPRYLDERHARITVMGDALSGKTSFILRCISDTFTNIESGTYMEDIYHTKINLSNLAQDINMEYGNPKSVVHSIEVQMLDTAEFEIGDFSDIRNEQILQSDAFILCFDLTNIESFLNLRRYQRRIEKVRGIDDNVPVLIAGTKLDLMIERCVDIKDIMQTLQRFEIDYKKDYFEISSKLNINVKDLLYRALIEVEQYKAAKRKEHSQRNEEEVLTPGISSQFTSVNNNINTVDASTGNSKIQGNENSTVTGSDPNNVFVAQSKKNDNIVIQNSEQSIPQQQGMSSENEENLTNSNSCCVVC